MTEPEKLRKEIVKLSQSYHNLGMTYTDFVEKCDNLINQFKKEIKYNCAESISKSVKDGKIKISNSQLITIINNIRKCT